MILKHKIGNGVYKLRNNEGYSRQDFADMANISLNSLTSIENGKSLVKIDTLIEILSTLSIPLSDFFEDLEL